jgi:hypothetical protein
VRLVVGASEVVLRGGRGTASAADNGWAVGETRRSSEACVDEEVIGWRTSHRGAHHDEDEDRQKRSSRGGGHRSRAPDIPFSFY